MAELIQKLNSPLNVDVRGKQISVSKSQLISIGCYLFALLFFIISWSTNGWSTVTIEYLWGKEKLKIGLWAICKDQCTFTSPGNVSGSMRATQAFMMFIFLLFIFGAFAYFSKMENQARIITVCNGITTFLMFLTIIIYGARYKDNYNYRKYTNKLSYSYGLLIVSFFGILASTVFEALNIIPKQIPKTEIDMHYSSMQE